MGRPPYKCRLFCVRVDVSTSILLKGEMEGSYERFGLCFSDDGERRRKSDGSCGVGFRHPSWPEACGMAGWRAEEGCLDCWHVADRLVFCRVDTVAGRVLS